MKKKQSEINLLQLQVNDLNYELENKAQGTLKPPFSLSKEAEDNNPNHLKIRNSKELQLSLKEKLQHYIDMARQLSRENPFNKRGVQLPYGTMVIDQRRLFDHLENDESDVVLVYSLEEKRFVFINQQIRHLLGWAPDQFVRDFDYLIQKGYEQWEEALRKISHSEIQEVRLLIKTFSGQNILTHLYLKKMGQPQSDGVVLGILASAAKR